MFSNLTDFKNSSFNDMAIITQLKSWGKSKHMYVIYN